MKTLVVEDEVVSQALLVGLLKRYSSVVAAGNLADAKKELRTALHAGEPFDLVCLDLQLGAKSGLDVLRELRKLESEAGRWPSSEATKVLMTTSSGAATDIIGAFRENCDGYLVKPVSDDVLNRELLRLGFRLS